MSEGWRKNGNKYYTSATSDLCSTVKEQRLKEALKCYHRAVELATTKQERASATKNYAMTAHKLGDIAAENGQVVMMQHHYKEAVSHFVKAQEAGETVMNVIWKENIAERLQECVGIIMAASVTAVTDTRKRVIMIDSYRNQLSDNHKLLPDIYLFLTELIFGGAVIAVGSGNYKEALSLLADAHFPIEETKRLCKNRADVLQEIEIYEQDVYYQKCAAESLQACVLGDELLQRAIIFDEPLNMDMIWDVIDWYRKAIVLTREKDVELEAIGLSKLGALYHRVLKMSHRAKDNYMKCVQLAMSLHPRTFDTDEWFKEAKKVLAEYQSKLRWEEEAKQQKERAKFLEELKDELDKLKDQDKAEDVSFLEFVYKTWPPKRKDFKMEELPKDPTSTQKKKAFQKAVIHYHPDKINVEEHGMKWKVLCEEIVKVLTRKYECYKGSVSD